MRFKVLTVGLLVSVCMAAQALVVPFEMRPRAMEDLSPEEAKAIEQSTDQKKVDETTKKAVDDDVYYLDDQPAAPAAKKLSKAEKKARAEKQKKEFEEKVPLIDRQEDQFQKLMQARDNPKPTLLKHKNIGLSGLLDIDYRSQTRPNFTKSRSNDVNIAFAKVNLDGNIEDKIHAHVGMLYADRTEQYYPRSEGKDTQGIKLDEATILFKDFKCAPIYFQFGQQYLPFGSYHRFPIIKPMTQKLTEIRQTAGQLGFVSKQGFYGALYLFDGLKRFTHDKKYGVYNGGGVIGFNHLQRSLGIDVGVGYLNNMADVGAINHTFPDNYYTKRVGGLSVHADVMTGPFNFVVRYVRALDHFSVDDFAYQKRPDMLRGAKPQATTLRAGYAFKTFERNSKLNIGYQWSKEAYNVNSAMMGVPQIPKNRFEFTYAIQVFRPIILGLQYDRDRDYVKKNGGTNNFNHIITFRITAIL